MEENEILCKKLLISANVVFGEKLETGQVRKIRLPFPVFTLKLFSMFSTWIFRAEIGANWLDFGEFCSVLFAFSSEGKKKRMSGSFS